MSVAIMTFMGKTYREYEPDQQFLMPPSLQDWLPEGHLVYFISDLVDDMDLSGIEGWYEREDRGQPPYHPRMMTKVLLYGYCVGVFSSRSIQKGLLEDVGFRVIAAGNTPDFRTISEFRRIHREALAGLYEQGLKMALGAGAVKLGRVVLDGTKVKANASKHKAMSYGYMEKREGALREEVAGLLERAEQEDASPGRKGRPRRKRSRRQRISIISRILSR
jgi:transposase